MSIQRVRQLLLIVLASAGAVLLWRAVHGPFRLVLPVTSPLNAQSIFGVAFVLSAIAGAVQARSAGRIPGGGFGPAALLLPAACSFVWALGFPFLSDEYVLLRQAAEYGPATLRWSLANAGGDGMYRPFAGLWMAGEWRLFGADPARWHAAGLVLHLANASLLYFLVKRLCSARAAAWSAAVFAVHGALPESVIYMAARFDLLATFSVLASLSLFVAGRRRLAVAPLVCGLFSKEAAFVFPLLACLAARGGARERLRLTWPYFAVSATAFLWRWHAAGGIGGYRDPANGGAQALHFSVLGWAKAFGLRIWSLFFFPVNWSVEPGLLLTAALAAGLCGYLLAARSAVRAPVVLTALGATVAAVLPAAHLALISSDLYGAPRLYLASAGFAALLGTAVAAVPGRAQPAAGAAILLFHLVALQHNLLIWRDVAATARQTCREASSGFAAPQFPRALDGVPFLLNGYFECVAIERGNAAWLR